jgi:hypothetical protein
MAEEIREDVQEDEMEHTADVPDNIDDEDMDMGTIPHTPGSVNGIIKVPYYSEVETEDYGGEKSLVMAVAIF